MELTDEQWGRFWSLLLQFPLKEKTAAADPPARSSRCAKRHPLDTAHRSALEGSPRTLSSPYRTCHIVASRSGSRKGFQAGCSKL